MKAALFGYGYWGQKVYLVLKSIFEEVLVVEPKASAGNSEKILRVNQEEVFTNSEITHCFIATPEEIHFQLAKKCLLAEKDIFVEKPLALDHKNAGQLIKLALEKQCCLFTDYIFLYDPAAQLIKEFLFSLNEEWLKVKSLRYSSGIDYKKVAITDDLLIHDLYLAKFWFKQDRELLSAQLQQVNLAAVQPIDEAQVEFKVGEVLYQGRYRWQAEKPSRELEIIGKKTKINWLKNNDGDRLQLYKKVDKNWLLEKTEKIKKNIQPLQRAIKHFLALSKSESTSSCRERYQNYQQDVHFLQKVRARLN